MRERISAYLRRTENRLVFTLFALSKWKEIEHHYDDGDIINIVIEIHAPR